MIAIVSAPVGSTTSTNASSVASPGRPSRLLCIGTAQVLGADPENHGSVLHARCRSVGERQRRAAGRRADPEGRPAGAVEHLRWNEVHRGRTHEAGHEHVGGPVVDGLRLVELLQASAVHHGDARGQRHGLDLVVGDVDGRFGDALVQLLDLDPHVDAELGVEVRERLVEQEQRGIAHQRPAHRHALPLPARQLAGLAPEEGFDLQQRRDPLHRLVLLGLGHPAALHAEGDVLPHRHGRVERVGLEHHGDVPVLRLDVVDQTIADADLAGGDRLEPRDHRQQGGFAATRRPHERDELA